MMDIGIVYYQIRPTGNVIDATWYSTRSDTKEAGHGIAKGDTTNGFEGHYTITYFYPDGRESATFDLIIEKQGVIYELSYNQDGKRLLMGVGLETPNGLAAGYRKIESA
ncbi:MAG: hypothetical protein AAF485_03340 [Chloroflexota bacterium]